MVSVSVWAQKVASGPMVGYSEMREVLIWVQTTDAAKVQVRYWVSTLPGTKFVTDVAVTAKNDAFIAKLVADKVQPDSRYTYELLLNGKVVAFNYPLTFQSKPLWLYRRDAPDVNIALGSCAYFNDAPYDRPGEPYGGNYEIYTSILAKKPDLMLWLGDNNYLREADWDTRTGILYRFSHGRAIKELQPLLASVHHYAIWDDHDFGPNDSDRSFWNKETTLEAFKLFWGNPSYGVAGVKGAITQFNWSDVEFFMLDNRYHRTPNNRKSGECTVLGKEQLEWLKDALTASKAPFKLVAMGGQFVSPLKLYENYANLCPQERDSIIQYITREKISGVIFLSGDRHHSELSKLERAGTYPLYDFTVSPLGSKANAKAKDEANPTRMPDSFLGERNFGMISVTGPKNERKLTFKLFDVNGVEKYSHTISAKDLKP